MPFGEEHSNQVIVAIDGTTLREDVAARLVSAYVDDSVHVPSMAVLRFSDERLDIVTDMGVKIGSALRVSVQQSGQGAPVEIFDGDVTALEQELDEDGAVATVRALDVRYRLHSGATTDAFTNLSVSDIVSKVVKDAGLTARVGSFGPQHDHLARDGESSWELLCRLARRVGAAVWVEGRTVRFDTPTSASTAPGGTDPRTDPLVIARGRNLLSLRATLTGTGQVTEVQARGWDYKTKQEVTATGQVRTDAVAVSETPTALAKAVNGTSHVVRVAGPATQAATATAATTVAAARAGGFAELEGVARGNPRLRAATAVALADVGEQFSGRYVLTTARHEFDPDRGYVTSFCASDVSDRSVYGVLAGAAPAAAGDGVRHLAPALVTNIKDPDALGRVKVKLPYATSYESWWARPVQLGAGVDRGVSWLPEVGDEVLVGFGHSLDEPYVLGGLYNGKDKAGKGWAAHVDSGTGTVRRRALTSRKGMVVELLEDSTGETLAISTNGGTQHLTFTQSGEKGIVLVSQGALAVTAEKDVTVTGRKDVTVTASTGNLSVKANNVTIEATSALSLKGAQVNVEGKASATVKAPAAKVEGTGTAELTATGVTTVRGAMVKIN